jgi:Cft2 family RNA processing exonuclease
LGLPDTQTRIIKANWDTLLGEFDPQRCLLQQTGDFIRELSAINRQLKEGKTTHAESHREIVTIALKYPLLISHLRQLFESASSTNHHTKHAASLALLRRINSDSLPFELDEVVHLVSGPILKKEQRALQRDLEIKNWLNSALFSDPRALECVGLRGLNSLLNLDCVTSTKQAERLLKSFLKLQLNAIDADSQELLDQAFKSFAHDNPRIKFKVLEKVAEQVIDAALNGARSQQFISELTETIESAATLTPDLLVRLANSSFNIRWAKRSLSSEARIPEFLSRISPDRVAELARHSALGYRIPLVARLLNGEICAFSEIYPEYDLPCNGGAATSLREIADSDGPRLAVHEQPLEILGVRSLAQINAIRIVRGLLPELVKFELLDGNITLSLAIKGSWTGGRLIKQVERVIREHFPGAIIAYEGSKAELIHDLNLASEDRRALARLSNLAWATSSASRIRELKLQGIQTTLLDTISGHCWCIGEPLKLGYKQRSLSWQMTEHWPIFLHNHATYDPIRSDSTFEQVMNLAVTPKEIWLEPNGELKFSYDRLDNTLFGRCQALIPSEWGLTQAIESPCGKRLLITSRDINAPHLPDELNQKLEQVLNRQIFYPDTRYSKLEHDDPKLEQIAQLISTGHILKSVERCEMTGEYRIHTIYKLSSDLIANISKAIGAGVSNSTPSGVSSIVDLPSEIRGIVTVVALAPAIKPYPTKITDSSIRKITFLGSARGIGGSAIVSGDDLLLDYGGSPPLSRSHEPLREPALGDIKHVIATHSHLDHIGRLPQLAALGRGEGPQILTHFGAALMMFPNLQEELRSQVLTDRPRRLRQLYKLVVPVPFGIPIRIKHDRRLTFIPSGHIPAAAMTLVEEQRGADTFRLLYTSDLYSSREYGPINRIACDLQNSPRKADALIIEGTNGTKDLPSRLDSEALLLGDIQAAITRGGRAILPVIAQGRGLEVVKILLSKAEYFVDQGIPIYMDGKLLKVFNSTFRYLCQTTPEIFDSSLSDSKSFWRTFEQVVKFVPEDRIAKDGFIRDPKPKVIIASGGMGQGRSGEYFQSASELDSIIFTCYQAENSRGARLLGFGDKPKSTWCKAHISYRRLTGHLSISESLNFVRDNLVPGGTLLLCHGSLSDLSAIRDAHLEQGYVGKVIIPEAGETVEL